MLWLPVQGFSDMDMVQNKALVRNYSGVGMFDSQFKCAPRSWQIPADSINVFDLAAIDVLFIQSVSE